MDGGEITPTEMWEVPRRRMTKDRRWEAGGVGGGICNKGKMIHRAQFKEQTWRSEKKQMTRWYHSVKRWEREKERNRRVEGDVTFQERPPRSSPTRAWLTEAALGSGSPPGSQQIQPDLSPPSPAPPHPQGEPASQPTAAAPQGRARPAQHAALTVTDTTDSSRGRGFKHGRSCSTPRRAL